MVRTCIREGVDNIKLNITCGASCTQDSTYTSDAAYSSTAQVTGCTTTDVSCLSTQTKTGPDGKSYRVDTFVAYSCSSGALSGATYAGSGTSASTTCTYDDGDSNHTVKARIIDKDGGFTQYTTIVAVKMSFYPVEFKGIPPYLGWQGQIPSHAAKMASIAMDSITTTVLGSVFAPLESVAGNVNDSVTGVLA